MKRTIEVVETMAILLRADINHDYNNGNLTASAFTLHAISLIEELEKHFNLDNRESAACYEYLNYKLKGSN